MGFLRRKQEDKKSTELAKVGKPVIYFATKSGIRDGGTGGLLAYITELTGERLKTIDSIGDSFKTEGFSYQAALGLILQGENKEDARDKILNQRDNKINEDNLKKLEEKLAEGQKTKPGEEAKAYKISEEMKKKLIGKTGIEAVHGIIVDYEKAVEGLREWKRFES